MTNLYEEIDLLALPPGTVIAGPDWHNEVYKKVDTDEWYGIGSDAPWTARALTPRGPFHILKMGET